MSLYLEFWPYILVTSLFSSVAGAISYAVGRSIEAHWKLFPWLVGIPLLVWCMLMMFYFGRGFPNLPFFVLALSGSTLGGWFHRKSGGASCQWFSATLLMVIVFIGSLFAWEAIGHAVVKLNLFPYAVLNPGSRFWKFYIDFGGGMLLAWSRLLYPILAPLALWIWQNLKAKPGIEVNLS